MFKIFKKAAAARLPDFSALGIDLHSHLLPGIDDGAKDMEQSLELIGSMVSLGFKEVITTPHIMQGFYPNTRDIILRKEEEVREALQALGIPLKFSAAAEYFLDETFEERSAKEPLLTLPGQRVLVEMSFRQPYPAFHQTIFDLQMKGYQPILAHPERYAYFRSAEDYEKLRAIGCSLQINLLSLTGYYGKPAQTAARTILELELADFLATDMHHDQHAAQLQAALAHELVINAIKDHRFQNALLGQE